MKRNFLLLLFFMAICGFAMAQQQIRGTVTNSEDGEPMIGVTILERGTTNGTVSDFDGSYELTVQPGAVLEFSYTGFSTQEITVGSESEINVLLSPGVQLQEVTVTALGIERSTKALQYSVTDVSGDEFQEAREVNVANALSGRIAGVNVSNIASGPAGSSRIIIRGNASLQGNNQPLYVVDGIPMDNSGFGQAGIWGGRDEGDGLSSINPDDIASITVLKGASAAALYGSRAANGVINIITKQGTKKKGIGVEFRSNYTFDRINDLREYQTEYGQGDFISTDPTNPDAERIPVAPRNQGEGFGWNLNSWGPRLESAANFVAFDGTTQPYSDAGNNYDRYYRTGSTLTNSLALTGGSATQNFRFAVADLRNESIIPNSGFDRTNVSLSTNSKFGERLTLTAKVLYSHEEAKNRPYLSDSPANGILSMAYLPVNGNIDWYKGDPNKLGAVPDGLDPDLYTSFSKSVGEEYPIGNGSGANWTQNPWWVSYQFDNDDTRDRLITSGQLRYDITDWLYIQGRAGMDWYTRRETDLVPQGTGYQRGGSLSEGESRVREINLEYILGVSKEFGSISVNAFFGGNRMRRQFEDISANGSGFNVPFFEAINNTVTRSFGFGFNESGINSIYGSAEIGYNNYLYLTATARKDWFSVLNPANNNILYPSLGLSFVFTDALNIPTSSALSFGKFRASWAQVGNVTINPYATNLTYSLKQTHLGYTLASFSSAGGQNGLIPNPDIKPLTSTEIEFGFDLRFFNNRLGLDVTYYRQKTTEDILDATISRASGFGRTTVNLGEMRNNGIELLLSGTPVRGPLTWDVSFNVAKNDNEVVSLIEGASELTIEEPRTRTVFTKHIVGYPFGMITGLVHRTAPNGQKVYDSNNGSPIESAGYEIIGNGIADWTGGLNNAFTYKNFNLDFLIDFKIGGDIYSGTNVRLTQAGLTETSLQGRVGKDPLVVEGVTQTGTNDDGSPIYSPFSKTLTPSEARTYWGNAARTGEVFTYDASFIKLRQISFGYNFPRTFINKTPFANLRLSFVGRNLAILLKNTPNIDPESSYNNNNGGQGLDYFGFPATRSYGFDLKADF
ncbi:MAG: SusC/RagA family TonB-linked outer membrane protein [Saprospiraceae bacterium]|nr:SusC/RagA family TonB-linked outer membrane protein [Saprospiraceae bacterium]